MNSKNKKSLAPKNLRGFSLVEVVVALSILAVVFAGTVTLVITVVNLAMTARTKTMVVALAQKQLAEGVDGFNGDPLNYNGIPSGSVNGLNYSIRVDKTAGSFNFSDTRSTVTIPIGTSNFVRIVSTVTPADGSLGSYSVFQFVRRNQ